MTPFARVLDAAKLFLFGLCVGAGFVTVAINQHPVIYEIIQREGGDVEGRFMVVCATAETSHVNCTNEGVLTDAN